MNKYYPQVKANGRLRHFLIQAARKTRRCRRPIVNARLLLLPFAVLTLIAFQPAEARADGIVVVTTPVSSLTTILGPAFTNFSSNVAQTALTQNGPPVNVLLGTFGPNLLSPLSLTNSTKLVVDVNLSGSGIDFTPPSLQLVGTYNVALAQFTFAPLNVSFTTLANDCGSFSVVANPLSLTALLTGGALSAQITNVFCGTCPGKPPETNPVPEPATLGLLATGLTGVAGYARRRFRRKSAGKGEPGAPA